MWVLCRAICRCVPIEFPVRIPLSRDVSMALPMPSMAHLLQPSGSLARCSIISGQTLLNESVQAGMVKQAAFSQEGPIACGVRYGANLRGIPLRSAHSEGTAIFIVLIVSAQAQISALPIQNVSPVTMSSRYGARVVGSGLTTPFRRRKFGRFRKNNSSTAESKGLNYGLRHDIHSRA
jgi:hypothetical protein